VIAALALVALGGAVALRAGAAARAGAFTGNDQFFHQRYVELIRANGHRVPSVDPRVRGPGRSGYPALLHVLASFVPADVMVRVGRYSGIVGDLVVGCLAAALLHSRMPAVSVAEALAGLYVLAPGLTFFDVGPRAEALSPRTLSRTLYGLAVLALMAYGPRGGAIWAVLPLALMLLTSKFALQVLLISFPVAAAIVGSYELGALVVGAAAIAFALSLGFFGVQVRHQLEHLEWFWRRYVMHLYSNTGLDAVRQARGTARARALGELLLVRSPLIAGIARHPQLIAAIAWALASGLAVRGASGPLAQSQAIAFALGCGAAAAWFLTSLGRLRILGEPERYLQFGFPAGWFLFWSLPSASARHVLLAVGFPLFVTAFLASLRITKAWARERGVDDLADVVRFIAGVDRPVVLCVDVSETYAFLGAPDATVCLYNGLHLSLRGEMADFTDWFLWRYPWVNPKNLSAIVERFGVTHVVVRKEAARRLADTGAPSYDFSGSVTAIENERYLVRAVQT
jgi:hypothetical protein